MHKLLARQVRRCFGSIEDLPAELGPFLPLVDAAYGEADEDRRFIEHSMDTVSRELSDHNRQLQDALSMLEATIESTTDGVFVVDRADRIVRANHRFAELWRIPDDLLGTRDHNRFLAFAVDQLEEPDEFLRKIQDLRDNPEAGSFDTLRFRDHRVLERYSMPHRVGGSITGRVWSFRDVTSRLELEGQLRQSQKMEAIGLLAGGVAHDFNNLLTVIVGHLELLSADPNMTPDHRDDIEQMGAAAGRAASLTRQLLAFGRKQVQRPIMLNLSAVVEELSPMLQRLIGEDMTLDVTLSDQPACMTADRGQIEQILVNLVINARDAMPSGGVVAVRVANVDLRDEARTRARGGSPGPHVALSVSDSGEGIAAEHLPRIFEPFFTTKELGKGTGLGLSTVYGIVQQSGGFIEVHSAEGVGTTFELFFPATAVVGTVALPEPEGAARPVAPSAGFETILVVEDESALLPLIAKMLRRSGYTVLTAASGREALAVALDHKGAIDLVVTDVIMPMMGGPTLMQHLQIARPNVPVLFLSGYTDNELVRRGALQPGVVLLEKPFNAEQLTQAVRSLLNPGKVVSG